MQNAYKIYENLDLGSFDDLESDPKLVDLTDSDRHIKLIGIGGEKVCSFLLLVE